ncbi:MAG: LytTR family DNA-binding domain-containing protein [Edaphocola sp.]
MKRLTAMIIDDEPDCVKLLQLQLKNYCPNVGNIVAYTSTLQALAEIETVQPDVVFLDIEMPVMSGFEFLQKLMPLKFNVIFVTAYNQYALKAFRFNAIDFLLKPIDEKELAYAVIKAEKNATITDNQLSSLKQQVAGAPIHRLAVATQTGVMFVKLDDIVYCEADNNYAKLLMTDRKTILVSKTLKDIQDILEESHFLRIHRQYIVNLNHVLQFNRNEGLITMYNNVELPVSKQSRIKFVKQYKWLG